jgi:hypothetical protein
LKTLGPDETSFKDKSVGPGIRYAYKLAAVDEKGYSGLDSKILYVTTPGEKKIKEGKKPKLEEKERWLEAGFPLWAAILAGTLILGAILLFIIKRK